MAPPRTPLRRVDPRLMAAFEQAAVAPAEETQPEAQPAPSRLDVIRKALEMREQPAPDFGAEPDLDAARVADQRANFASGMMGVGAALLGDRSAPYRVRRSNSNEQAALAQRDARRKAIQDWAAQQDRTRLGEAEILSKASAPVPAKNPELENRKLDIEQQKVDIQREKANRPRGGKGAADGKMLPPTTVEGLADLPVAEQQVDELADEFHRLGMGGISGRVSGAATDILGLRFTDSAEYNAAAKRAMQAAGKILEGGKLAAGDEAKYASMLPRPGDSEEVVTQKVQGMKTFLRSLAAQRAKGLKESGYKVAPSLVPSEETPPIPQTRTVVRTGTNKRTGRRVVEYSDGTREEQ